MSKPSVLFVCVHNAGRSQMAAAFLTHLSAGAGRGPLRRIRARRPGQPGGRAGHGRGRHRHRRGEAEDPDRPRRPRVRRGDHHGLRRHLPVLPGQTLRGLGAGRPGRQRCRRPSGPSATTSDAASRRCSTTSFRQARARDRPGEAGSKNADRAAAPSCRAVQRDGEAINPASVFKVSGTSL